MKNIKNIISKFFSKQSWSKIYLKKRFYFVSSLFVLGFVLLDIEECAADLDNQVYDQKVNIAKDGNGNNNLGNLPLASKAEINELVEQSKRNKDIINPDVARKIAIVEFEERRQDNDKFINASLSKKPIVIYNSLNSLPKYYEFILLDPSQNPVGTLTVYATKSFPIIKTVLPFVRAYSKTVTKSVNQKIFSDAGLYPSRIYYGIPTKSGEKPSSLIDAETGKENKVTTRTFEEHIQFLRSLTPQQLKGSGLENIEGYISSLKERKT